MSEPIGGGPAAQNLTDQAIKGRWVALTVWLLVGGGLIVAGIINGALEMITFEYVVAGLIAGAWCGAFVAFMMLLPDGRLKWAENDNRPESFMGIGSRPLALVSIAFAIVFGVIREGWPIPGGPIDAVTFVTSWSIGVAALYYDLWVATPRRIAGENYDPTNISDGGQTGLSDRTGAVVFWLIPLGTIIFLMLAGWSFVGVDEVNLRDGFLTGIAVGSVLFIAAMIAASASYAHRVRRHQRFAARGVVFEVIVKITGWIIGLAAIVALVEELGFCAGMFAAMIATACGLAATIIDRWVITPRKMDRGDRTPTSAAVAT